MNYTRNTAAVLTHDKAVIEKPHSHFIEFSDGPIIAANIQRRAGDSLPPVTVTDKHNIDKAMLCCLQHELVL